MVACEKLRQSLFWTPNRAVGRSCITSGGVAVYRKSGAIALKAEGPNPACGHFKEWVSLMFWAGEVHRNRGFREAEQGAPSAFFGGFWGPCKIH